MIVIPPQDFKPFLCVGGDPFVGEQTGGCHLAPHQEAHFVGMVQKPGILDFLVFPAAVEAHLFHDADILHEIVIGRCCQNAVFPVALIQYQLEVVRAVVQISDPVPCVDLAHAEIAFHRINDDALYHEPQGDVEKGRVFRAPQAFLFVGGTVKDVVL